MRYDDPKLLRDAAERVEITPRADLSGVETIVEVDVQDGSTLSERCDHPRGSPELPVSWDEIEQKFRAYAPARLSPGRIDAVVDCVARLEQLGSVRELMDALRATAPASISAV